MLADETFLRSDSKTPKLGKTGCRKFKTALVLSMTYLPVTRKLRAYVMHRVPKEFWLEKHIGSYYEYEYRMEQ